MRAPALLPCPPLSGSSRLGSGSSEPPPPALHTCSALAPLQLSLIGSAADIVVPDVLTPEEVAAANAVVDANYEKTAVAAQHMKGQAAVPDGSAVGDQDRWDLRGMLGWPQAEREPFQRMLGHPKLTRYLNDICGKGFRMDHAPTLITQMTGSPSGGLHGSSGPGFDPASYYVWKDGQMHNGLVVASFQLVDCPEGAGGL